MAFSKGGLYEEMETNPMAIALKELEQLDSIPKSPTLGETEAFAHITRLAKQITEETAAASQMAKEATNMIEQATHKINYALEIIEHTTSLASVLQEGVMKLIADRVQGKQEFDGTPKPVNWIRNYEGNGIYKQDPRKTPSTHDRKSSVLGKNKSEKLPEYENFKTHPNIAHNLQGQGYPKHDNQVVDGEMDRAKPTAVPINTIILAEDPKEISQSSSLSTKSQYVLTKFYAPLSTVFQDLKREGYLVPKDPTPSPNPIPPHRAKWYCDYHQHIGHSTNRCKNLHKAIRDLIQQGTISLPPRDLNG